VLTDKELANQAYKNEQLDFNAQRLPQLIQYLKDAVSSLKSTGVTRQTIWAEYLQIHPDGYGYSQFCFHLSEYQKNRDLSMHMEYTPGDMIMVDFTGKHLYYVDAETGERIKCEVFIGIMPYCGLIFCKAVHTQQISDFIQCINEMLLFYRGVPATILCDNLKTAVTRPCRYEPGFTEICNQLSDHYQTTFSATRPYSPRDKGMVEKAVGIVYTNIFAPLRHTVFSSLEALNTSIYDQLIMLNNKAYKNTVYSRWYFYDQHESSSLKSLATEPFAPKKVVILTVQRNYHIQLSENHHYYSVPYQYVGKKVKV
ncbi:IS21 family transposase, partial [Cylindrospermopsis raciborskii]